MRRVRERGTFTWKHENVFLSKTLSGERIGLLPIDDRYYRVYFAAFPLARFDSWKRQIERLRAEDGEQEQCAENAPAATTTGSPCGESNLNPGSKV